MSPADPNIKSGNTTPLTRQRNRGRKRAESRKPQQSPQTPVGSEPETSDTDLDPEGDSQELFELLGLSGDADAVPVEKGLLRLSKENMDAALGTTKKKRVRTKNKPRTDKCTPVDQRKDRDASPTPNALSRRKKAAAKQPITTSSREPSPDALDMSAMSRSLPAGFFTEENNGSADVWDMPESAGHDGLTWQQQLQSEDTPSKRSNRSTPSEPRRRKATPKTHNHDRHQSLEDVPVSNLTKMIAAAGPSSAGTRPPVSAFDASIPFHTGYNVHRAPQTPVRTSANIGTRISPAAIPQAISLPIVGDFPRINKSGAPIGGPKYAGPTFHNSPASDSLPKPDLDDF